MPPAKLKVLASAYACEPDKGSEPGVGWNWVKQIARFHEVWVITRANNRESIEKELSKNFNPNLHFVYVDLPDWLKFWKRGNRGVHIYYYLWQIAAYFKARKLCREVPFDLSHNVTFVNDWIPSGLSLLNIPFIWGPVGSNVPIPRPFLLNAGEYYKDRIKHFVRFILRRIDLFYHLTFQNSLKIICILENQLHVYPFKEKSSNRLAIQQAIAVNANEITQDKRHSNVSKITVYSAGALIPIKGFHLAIPAFASAKKERNDIQYVISGSGYFKSHLQALIKSLELNNTVKLTANIEREKVLNYMQEVDIFLFPSFEAAGMVVLEAMASSLPVICLDYGGPGEMVTDECGIKVKPTTLEQTIKELSEAIMRLADNPDLRRKMGEAGRKRVEEFYTWEKKGEFIQKLYREVMESESTSRS